MIPDAIAINISYTISHYNHSSVAWTSTTQHLHFGNISALRTCSDDGCCSASSLPTHAPTLLCWASSAAALLAADASLTDTTPYRLSALKGALAAGGSARGGELRRSRGWHPRQGCRGRARCDGAGSQRPWAAPRRARAQGSPRSLRIWAYTRYSEIV